MTNSDWKEIDKDKPAKFKTEQLVKLKTSDKPLGWIKEVTQQCVDEPADRSTRYYWDYVVNGVRYYENNLELASSRHYEETETPKPTTNYLQETLYELEQFFLYKDDPDSVAHITDHTLSSRLSRLRTKMEKKYHLEPKE